MIYKNKNTMMIVLLIAIVALLYFAYQFKSIEYRVFGTIGVALTSIQYIFTLFEYYKIDEDKITHVYRLGFKKDEVFWKDIDRVFIFSDSYFKAIRIDYGMPFINDMIINSGLKGYKELIKIIIDKTKDNPGISIDKRLESYLK